MNWIEFTCGQCGNKYTEQTGDTDERMCDECLNHEDEFGYDVDVDENGPFISKIPAKRRIEVEITYEGEEE